MKYLQANTWREAGRGEAGPPGQGLPVLLRASVGTQMKGWGLQTGLLGSGEARHPRLRWVLQEGSKTNLDE